MKTTHSHRWHWLLPVLAAFIATTTFGQGIIHVQAPIANPDDTVLPWNAFGTQIGQGFPIIINGQTVLNFVTSPSGFFPTVAQPSPTSAVIGKQINPNFPNEVWALPLAYGTEIGPNLANGGWFDGGGSYDDPLLASIAASGEMGNPFLYGGWFPGTDPANTYLGFCFQEDGNTYYGWAQVGTPLLAATWIYGYAYSTIPNMPIFAGQVPEPSTWALLGLGGMVLVLVRRKRPFP